MNDDFTKKLSVLKQEHLSEEERSLLRRRIVEMTTRTASVPSPFRLRDRRRAVATVSVTSLFLLTAGVSFAAETALPGEPLYPVKVHVNEGVKRVMARTPEAKAVVAQAEVERRAQEVELLSKDDRLDDQVKATLISDTTDSLRTFDEARTKLVREGKVKEAKDRERDMNETITRHREALSTLGIRDDKEQRSRGSEKKREEIRSAVSASTTVSIPVRHREEEKESRNEERQETPVSTTTSPIIPIQERLERRLDVSDEIRGIFERVEHEEDDRDE